MQYLLTQEEYDALTEAKRKADARDKATLLDVCIMAATHAPGRNGVKEPWGCILASIPQQRAECCDDCPAHAVCPHDGKKWSQ